MISMLHYVFSCILNKIHVYPIYTSSIFSDTRCRVVRGLMMNPSYPRGGGVN